MPSNVVSITKKLNEKLKNDTILGSFISELSEYKNKGVVLRKYDILQKGERWKKEELEEWLKEKGYLISLNKGSINTKLKIGDKVKIVDIGQVYSTYEKKI